MKRALFIAVYTILTSTIIIANPWSDDDFEYAILPVQKVQFTQLPNPDHFTETETCLVNA